MNEIFTRRSIRKYQNKPVEQEKLERILRAGMQAPSAQNEQPWEFIVIAEDREMKQQICAMSPYAGMAANAGALILVCSNLPVTDRNWWVEDLSACVQNMLLQIEAEGLGGVWLGWYPDMERVERTKRALKLPEQITPFAVISLGYPAEKKERADRFLPERVHYERY